MKRNPHPDLVRAALKRWRTRLVRALNEVARLEKALVRAEAKRKADALAQKRAKRNANKTADAVRELQP